MPPRRCPPLAAAPVLAALLAACGATGPQSPSATATATPAPRATSLFPPGASSSPGASASATPSQPVLDVSQLGFHMTFSPALGGVSYSIDSSHMGTVQDADGKTVSYEGSVDLATTAYAAAACASSFPSEAAIDVYTTDAASLRFISGPQQWVRAGVHLLGFRPPQNEPCNVTQFQHDLPLLEQMFTTAAAD